MKSLLQQLQNPNADQDGRRRTHVVRTLKEVIENLRHSEPLPRLVASDADAFVSVDPARFAAVLGHVIGNAQDAAGADGRVDIQITADQTQVQIRIEDDGVGMEPEFVRDFLFRPFYTTKSSRGMGIGAFQAREFIRAAGGGVDVTSQPGQGTVFAMTLPRVSDYAVPEVEAAGEVRA